MKQVAVSAVVLVDDNEKHYVQAVARGVDPLDEMEAEVRLALLETGFEGDDLNLTASIEAFEFSVSTVDGWDPWRDFNDHPRSAWRWDVAEGHTSLGYFAWRQHRINEEGE